MITNRSAGLRSRICKEVGVRVKVPTVGTERAMAARSPFAEAKKPALYRRIYPKACFYDFGKRPPALTRAGFPMAVLPAGTSRVTTLPAPMTA